MSLINQMLRDLQQQKKTTGQVKTSSLRPKAAERIPYLPLPVVLSGVGVVLLCFVWWLSGVLSETMFGAEPPVKTPERQQVVASEYVPKEGSVKVVAEEPDQLTLAEREAEAPLAPADSEVASAKKPVSFKADTPPAKRAESVPVVKPDPGRSAGVASKPSVAKLPSKTEVAAAPLVSQAPRGTQHHLAQAPAKPAAQASKRLHPDDLPGAVASSRDPLMVNRGVLRRTSRTRATTPYGRAEEAYLDAEWALANNRRSLATESLQQALLLYPGHFPARELLVETLDKEGQTGAAILLLAEGLDIAPDYIVFKKKYARLLMAQGDYDTAVKVMLKGGLPTVEDDPEAHVILASLYQNLGEPFLTAQTYRNLLVAWPQTGAFWVGLGGALENQSLVDEAIVCYQRALKTKNLRQNLSQYAKRRLAVLK